MNEKQLILTGLDKIERCCDDIEQMMKVLKEGILSPEINEVALTQEEWPVEGSDEWIKDYVNQMLLYTRQAIKTDIPDWKLNELIALGNYKGWDRYELVNEIEKETIYFHENGKCRESQASVATGSLGSEI